MCEIPEGDGAEVWNNTQHRARKSYRCDTCHQAIAPGQQYVKFFCVHDGEWTQERACLKCDADRASFFAEHGDGDCTPSHFPSLLGRCIQDGDDDSERWKPMFERIWANRAAAKSGAHASG